MKGRIAILSVLAVVLLAGSASADVLYWSDWTVFGGDQFPAAMTELGLSYTTAADDSDFNTKLAGESWDLAILFVQSSGYDFPSVAPYLGGGGKMILADWRSDETLGALFGVTYAGEWNTEPVTLTAPFLQNGIGAPMELFNPGYGIWTMSMSPTTATSGATFPSGNHAIAYTGNTIVNGFLPDTFEDLGVAKQLATNEIAYLLDIDLAVVPEPTTIFLLGGGLVGLVGWRRKRRNA